MIAAIQDNTADLSAIRAVVKCGNKVTHVAFEHPMHISDIAKHFTLISRASKVMRPIVLVKEGVAHVSLEQS